MVKSPYPFSSSFMPVRPPPTTSPHSLSNSRCSLSPLLHHFSFLLTQNRQPPPPRASPASQGGTTAVPCARSLTIDHHPLSSPLLAANRAGQRHFGWPRSTTHMPESDQTSRINLPHKSSGRIQPKSATNVTNSGPRVSVKQGIRARVWS